MKKEEKRTDKTSKRLMRIIKTNLKKISTAEINSVVDYLRRGKVVVYPTDTIYGIGCVATNKKAINRVYKIKKRNRESPLLVLVSSLAMAKRYCYISKKQEEYLRKVWARGMKLKSDFGYPKSDFGRRPVSVILRSRGVLPKELTGGGDNLAVRLPNSRLLVKIIRQVNAPIVSTSLNISGRKNLANVSKIEQYFKSPKQPFVKKRDNEKLPDLVVDAGEIKGKPSKLIDLTDINNILVIRN